MPTSAVDTRTKGRQHERREEVVAIVDAHEFDEARRDPRVQAFLTKADAYLASVERHV